MWLWDDISIVTWNVTTTNVKIHQLTLWRSIRFVAINAKSERFKLNSKSKKTPACSSISPTTEPIAAAWDLNVFHLFDTDLNVRLNGGCSARAEGQLIEGCYLGCGHSLGFNLLKMPKCPMPISENITSPSPPPILPASPQILNAAQIYLNLTCKLLPPIKIFPRDGRS